MGECLESLQKPKQNSVQHCKLFLERGSTFAIPPPPNHTCVIPLLFKPEHSPSEGDHRRNRSSAFRALLAQGWPLSPRSWLPSSSNHSLHPPALSTCLPPSSLTAEITVWVRHKPQSSLSKCGRHFRLPKAPPCTWFHRLSVPYCTLGLTGEWTYFNI